MQVPGFKVPTGNVYRVEGKRRPVWYARYRLAAGRDVRKRIGPAWTGRGRPAAGYFTKRTAEAWLSDVLDQARRGTLPGGVRTAATFAAPPPQRLRQGRHRRRGRRDRRRAIVIAGQVIEDGWSVLIGLVLSSFSCSPRSRSPDPALVAAAAAAIGLIAFS